MIIATCAEQAERFKMGVQTFQTELGPAVARATPGTLAAGARQFASEFASSRSRLRQNSVGRWERARSTQNLAARSLDG